MVVLIFNRSRHFSLSLHPSSQYIYLLYYVLYIVYMFFFKILFQHHYVIWTQFGPKLCNLMSQATMCHDWLSKNFEMQYDGVQQLDQSNISQFARKVLFLGKGNLGPAQSKDMQPCLMIHSLRIYLKFCGTMRLQTNVILVTFPKNFLFGQYRPIWLNITQPTAPEIFRNILA